MGIFDKLLPEVDTLLGPMPRLIPSLKDISLRGGTTRGIGPSGILSLREIVYQISPADISCKMMYYIFRSIFSRSGSITGNKITYAFKD